MTQRKDQMTMAIRIVPMYLILGIFLISCVTTQPSPKLESTSAPSFNKISFSELSNIDEGKNILPINITYPSKFNIHRRSVKSKPVLFIASDTTNIDDFINGKGASSIGNGFYLFTLSMRVAYNSKTNKFSNEGNPEQKDQMRRAGITNINERRVDSGGVPILEFKSEFNGRHIYLAYMALGDTGSVIKSMYQHPEKYSDQDDIIWNAFVSGF